MNAKSILFFDNVLALGSLSATDTDADTAFSVDNLIDLRTYTYWKGGTAPLINKVLNGDFETGDFTDHTANDATIDNTNPAAGVYSSKVVASGSDTDGSETDKITVDITRPWRLKAKVDVDSFSGGFYILLLQFYTAGDSLISTKNITFWDGVTSGYEQVDELVQEFFPANTAKVSIKTLWVATPTGTAYIDDIEFFEDPGDRFITVDLNEITNPGAESNDFTGWTQNDASIESGSPLSGSYSFKLVASGSDVDGALSDKVTDIDPLKTYRLKAKNSVSGHSAGDYKLLIHFYDAEDNRISTAIIQTWSADTGGTVSNSKSVGPTGSDIVIPAGTASVSIQDIADDTPTLTGLMDDVLFYEEKDPDGLGIMGHNLYTASASIKVESSDDAEADISSWTESLASFNPSDNTALFKSIDAVGPQRAWRIEIITVNIVPFMAVLILGERLTMERFIVNDFDPAPEAPHAQTIRSEAGNHLGTTIDNTVHNIQAEFKSITDAWYNSIFYPAWNIHIGQLKPFFWIWDLTNHPDEVFYVKVPDRFQLRAPFSPIRRTLTLSMESIKE